ncbi:hypothetical protein KVR01_010294 [Diaporthe batatas]|uniref:uncharacterized protein n=1 Tax=Diaporthe batatas TaxID=748121 RepID=UPI001D04ADD7|nr:uncharacterized protein KVR01_010294 [Diaporthe batatas]KAG8159657.1 hypothetical protein KVR01_010294 [Diaporthe batatas]
MYTQLDYRLVVRDGRRRLPSNTAKPHLANLAMLPWSPEQLVVAGSCPCHLPLLTKQVCVWCGAPTTTSKHQLCNPSISSHRRGSLCCFANSRFAETGVVHYSFLLRLVHKMPECLLEQGKQILITAHPACLTQSQSNASPASCQPACPTSPTSTGRDRQRRQTDRQTDSLQSDTPSMPVSHSSSLACAQPDDQSVNQLSIVSPPSRH